VLNRIPFSFPIMKLVSHVFASYQPVFSLRGAGEELVCIGSNKKRRLMQTHFGFVNRGVL